MKIYTSGIALVLLVSLSSLYISNIFANNNFSLSPLLISVIIGGFCSFLYKQNEHLFSNGINFSAKRLLRLGIILYGFNITLGNIASVGIAGITISVIVVIVIFAFGILIGKLLRLDKEIALLVSGGSAICGAAAVLALESSIKSKPHKGVIAVGTVVVFGLIAMFIYPITYNAHLVPFNHIQEGFYIGATLHEVANVVGAASAISPESEKVALIIKMIRVLLLVPTLFLLPLFFLTQKKGIRENYTFLGLL